MGARTTTTAALAALVLLTSACTSSSPPSAPPTGTTTGAAPTSAPASPDAPEARSRPLTIALAGDVHFEGVLVDRLRRPGTALAPVADALARADVAVVNLETSIGSGGRPEPGKRFTFSAGPEALTALAAAGVDVASMANNHALDFGRSRLPSTLRAVRAAASAHPPLAVVGIGRDAASAFRPATTEVDGAIVATIAASVADQDPTADPTGAWAATRDRPGIADAIDPSRLLRAVRRADRVAHVVVVYLHWGVQGERCPSADQRRLAAQLVAAGADVVAGSHAHRLQGDGRLGRGYVAYGLGNYAWYSPGTDATSRTGVLTLTVRTPAAPGGDARVVRAGWSPARIGADGLPRPDADLDDFRAERASLRACAGLAR